MEVKKYTKEDEKKIIDSVVIKLDNPEFCYETYSNQEIDEVFELDFLSVIIKANVSIKWSSFDDDTTFERTGIEITYISVINDACEELCDEDLYDKIELDIKNQIL